MRFSNKVILDEANTAPGDLVGERLDANQIINASFHIVMGDGTCGGVFKIQASNDPCSDQNSSLFQPTNWVDLPTPTCTITSGMPAMLQMQYPSYRWIRPVFTVTTPGSSTIQVAMFAHSV